MRSRIGISCFLMILLGMCFCGCGIAGKDSQCKLTVETYYSGWGIAEQDLGSGTFVVFDGTNFCHSICFTK